jgi:hypothetical protein
MFLDRGSQEDFAEGVKNSARTIGPYLTGLPEARGWNISGSAHQSPTRLYPIIQSLATSQ